MILHSKHKLTGLLANYQGMLIMTNGIFYLSSVKICSQHFMFMTLNRLYPKTTFSDR